MPLINSFLPQVNDSKHISMGCLHPVNNLDAKKFPPHDNTELFYKFLKNVK